MGRLTDIKNNSKPQSTIKSFVSGLTGDLVFPDPTENDTFGERVAEDVGEAIGLGLGGGAILSKVPAAAAKANTGRKALQNFASNIGKSFSNNPKTFLAVEGALGGTASVGGFAAVQNFPDSPVAEFVGTLLGGTAPQLAVGASKPLAKMTGRAAIAGAKKGYQASRFVGGKITHLLPLVGSALRAGGRGLEASGSTLAGSVRNINNQMNPLSAAPRARERFIRAGADLESVEQGLKDELIPNVKLSFAERSNNQGLLSIQKSIIKESKNDLVSRQAADRLEEANSLLIAEMKLNADEGLGLQNSLKAQQDYFSALFDTQLQVAAKKTEDFIGGWRGVTDKEQASVIARTQIRNAFDSALESEKQLWSAIPSDYKVPTDNLTKAYQKALREISKTQKNNMPSKASKWLRANKKTGQNKLGGKSGVAKVEDVRGLISDLRTVARNNRSGFGPQNLDKARIADELAEAINADMLSNLDEFQRPAVTSAVAFTKELNATFRNPMIAKLWSKTKRGNLQLNETKTLDSLIGSPTSNMQGYDAIKKAVGDNPEVNAAMESYIKEKFFLNSDFNATDAQRYLKTNKDLMTRMPRLKAEIEQAINLNDAQLLREKRIPRLLNPAINKATIFIERSPERAFREILASRTPAKDMTTVLRMANKDSTGTARLGLQEAFSSLLFNQSKNSNQGLDGAKLVSFLESPRYKQVMGRLFSKEQRARWDRVKNTAKRIDASQNAQESVEGITRDQASKLVTNLGKILGATAGRGAGTGTLQTPQLASTAFGNLAAAGIENPAERFIIDSVMDESGEVFRKLMGRSFDESGVAINEDGKYLINYINAWSANLLSQLNNGESDNAQ
jgi:hypothetical protein